MSIAIYGQYMYVTVLTTMTEYDEYDMSADSVDDDASSLGPADVAAAAVVLPPPSTTSVYIRQVPLHPQTIPIGRVLQKYTVLVIVMASVALIVIAARRDDIRQATTLLVAAAATVMVAAYVALLITPSAVSNRPERVRDIHFMGWLVTATFLTSRIFLCHTAMETLWCTVGIVVAITAAVAVSLLCLRQADAAVSLEMDTDMDNLTAFTADHPSSFWTARHRWTALALAAYWLMLLLFAWALRRITHHTSHVIARLVIALWAIYPLVYISTSSDTRDGWFAVLDTSMIAGVVILSIRMNPRHNT